MSARNFEIADAAQATEAAKTLLDTGSDGIKIHLQPPPAPNQPISESAIRAAVAEAHRAGRPVFIHPNSGADVLTAVRAGVDVIAHTTPSSGAWDGATLAGIKGRRVALTPTLTVWKALLRHDRVSAQEQAVAAAVGQLRAWVAAGGTVLFGSDLGAADYDPTGEYRLMADAGMSFRQILDSLTTAPAEHLRGTARTGRVAEGFTADLAILRGDPSSDVRALASVQYTLRDGTIVYRAPR